MNINSVSQLLDSMYKSLLGQAENTKGNWDDKVQQKFYSEFVEEYRKVVPKLVKSLNELHTEVEIAFGRLEELADDDY